VDFSKVPIFDVRLLGMISAALIALFALSKPGPQKKVARSHMARGAHGVQVRSCAFSPTGNQIATCNTEGRVALRVREEGWRIEGFLDFAGYASVVAFSADGRSLAAAGIAPGVCVWDMASPIGKRATVMDLPIQRSTHLLFSPDGKSLAVTTNLDGTILLCDLAAQRKRMVLHHPTPVVSIAFSPDGRWLATGGRIGDRSILLWNLKTGTSQALLENGPSPIVAIAFSPEGSLLATSSLPEHHVRLWDVKTKRLSRLIAGQPHTVNSVAFSPDGSLLATAGNDGTVRLWTMATGEQRATLDGQATCLRTVAFSSDGRTLVLATDDDDDVRLWDIAEVL
jgi:WD40 repeat protein